MVLLYIAYHLSAFIYVTHKIKTRAIKMMRVSEREGGRRTSRLFRAPNSGMRKTSSRPHLVLRLAITFSNRIMACLEPYDGFFFDFIRLVIHLSPGSSFRSLLHSSTFKLHQSRDAPVVLVKSRDPDRRNDDRAS